MRRKNKEGRHVKNFSMLILALILVVCIYIYIQFSKDIKKEIKHDMYFFPVFGQSSIAYSDYNEVIQLLGPAENEVVYYKKSIKCKDLIYPDYIIHISLMNSNSSIVSSVTVTSPQYELGSAKVHVGNSREEVIKKYSGNTEISFSEQDGVDKTGRGFVDDLIYIEFTYDENDYVQTIKFGIGP